MKLILCLECEDIIKLTLTTRRCECRRSWGHYTDNINAEIGGPCVPLGFANRSFARALLARPDEGEGARFEAFVIPKVCASITEVG